MATIPTGPHPRWIAVADVNHDHNPDIVVANAGSDSNDSGSIAVLLGDGLGGFHPVSGSPFPAGHLQNDIAIADMNNDGNRCGGLQNAPGSPFSAGAKPWEVSVGDLNGDGYADLIVTLISATLVVPCLLASFHTRRLYFLRQFAKALVRQRQQRMQLRFLGQLVRQKDRNAGTALARSYTASNSNRSAEPSYDSLCYPEAKACSLLALCRKEGLKKPAPALWWNPDTGVGDYDPNPRHPRVPPLERWANTDSNFPTLVRGLDCVHKQC